LERLTSLAVQQLADWCAIDVLVEETGEIEGLVVAHPDHERKRWAEEVRARTRPTRIDDDFDLTARVMRTGEPEFLREVPQELLEEAARRDPAAAAALAGLREVDAVGRRAAEVLPAWEELTRLAELADSATPERARPVTVPIETPSGDRWVAVTGVEFDEGVVYALRDVSDEHAF